MKLITRKYLSPRTMLRGLGVSVALPLHDSMVPAQTPLAKTAASSKSRLSCIYVPHGATMDKWTPDVEGKGFAFSEILTPLEKYRDRLNIVSNLAHPAAGGLGSDAGADHARSAAVFLSGAHPEKDFIRAGTTIDQLAAQAIGQDIAFARTFDRGSGVELRVGLCLRLFQHHCLEDADHAAADGEQSAGGVRETVRRWQHERRPRRAERAEPQFARLGDGPVATLKKDLPAPDRTRLNEYLDDVREIERRILKAQHQVSADLKLPEAPVGVPESFDEHFKIMFDLQLLAFRTEMTRVATLMYARDTSGAVYPQSGVRDGFHVSSHHGNNRANMDKYALINKYHVQMLAYFLGKLQATPDGDGTLLDHSMILYGSSMSNGNQHDHDPLPLILAGGASGQLNGGRHLKFAPHTPASNLLLSMLDKLGVHQDKHGDSTGKLDV